MSSRVKLGVMSVIMLAAAGAAWAALRSPKVTPEMLAEGKQLFERRWAVNDPLSPHGDGLGPVYNAESCVACHFQGGVGGGGDNSFNVTTFLVQPTAGQPVVREGVVHAFAIDEALQEGHDLLRRLFPVIKGGSRFNDGCHIVIADKDPLSFNSINTPPLFGLGLIEDLPGWAIHYDGMRRTVAAASKELSGDFSSTSPGAPRVLDNGRLGRFGWKGQFATLEEFVAGACAMELGLSNPLKKQPLPGKFEEDAAAGLDMNREQLDALVAFVRHLPRPEQIWPEDPAARRRAENGERLFADIGCADCHTPNLGGVEGLYSDLRLHDVETRSLIASGGYGIIIEEDAPWPMTLPRPQQWKTPPLWGVADSAPYFHDGASTTLESAILRHAMDAQDVTDRFEALTSEQQGEIIAFLKTLKAPVPRAS